MGVQIGTDAKIRFVDLLTSAGLQSVETTSFVSPKRVPQLADAAEVVQGICRAQGVRYPVLVPNMKVIESQLQFVLLQLLLLLLCAIFLRGGFSWLYVIDK